jgi:hypothetical protein
MRYICCQPAIKYYTWQIEVLINNFLEHGVNPNKLDIVCAIEDNEIPEDWIKLANHYNSVRFFFYNDTRDDTTYAPSIYFNLMKQHIAAREEVKYDVLYLHDSDIIFTKKPDFEEMARGNSWYLSDTNSYINYDYIKSKANGVYETMCDIIGIDKIIPKLMNNNSGGAQYIVKNTTYEFWDKVEKDSIALYKKFCQLEPHFKPITPGDYPIQKWTSGMWSLLWNAWLFGHETIVDKRMDFAWVTSPIEDVEKYTVLHNSGVCNENEGMFFKGLYTDSLPYYDELEISTEKGSYRYWEEVKKVAKISVFNETKLQTVFNEIYKENLWASAESKSGAGSQLDNTVTIRAELPYIFNKFNIKSILDIPCGDFNWMQHVDLSEITYIGADIVNEAVEANKLKYNKDFRNLDITKDDLPKSDLIFVRDCLGHLSNENVAKAIENVRRSGSTYLLATSFTKYTTNTDIQDGGWKCINLMVEPFTLNPIYLVNEDCQEGYPNYNDKCMILFKLN